MSDIDDLDDVVELLDRSGTRIDGRGGRHGNRGFAHARDRGKFARACNGHSSKRQPGLAKVNLPDVPAD